MSTAILWTGGKDSVMAFLEVRERLEVTLLVTFVPEGEPRFLAHPLECVRAQARALGLEHREVVVRAPFEQGYEAAIDALADEGIETLVTGDVATVDGHDNWIVERARARVEVVRPLLGRPRGRMLRALVDSGVRAVCTLARRDAFDRSVVGTVLEGAFLDELRERDGVDGFDACGENGEYHTCVLDAPGFAFALALEGPRVERTGELEHLGFDSIRESPRRSG